MNWEPPTSTTRPVRDCASGFREAGLRVGVEQQQQLDNLTACVWQERRLYRSHLRPCDSVPRFWGSVSALF